MNCKDSPFYQSDPNYRQLCDEGKVVDPATMPELLPPPRGLGAKVKSFSRAMAIWALAGFPVISEEGRKGICRACPQWNEQDDTCKICGCLLRWKRKLSTEHCPDDPPRW